MKKSCVLLSSLIIFLLFSTVNQTYGYDWTRSTPQPCTIGDTIGWGTYKTMRICGDSTPCSTCCYTVVYYEKWDPVDSRPAMYKVNVTGIFWEGDSSQCSQCSKDTMLTIFMKYLTTEQSQDTSFAQRLTNSIFPI